MKRLVDQEGPQTPATAEAVRLILAAEVGYRPTPGAKARVRLAMFRAPRPRSTPWLRATILATIGFASALASGATLRSWVLRHEPPPAAPSPVAQPISAPPPAHAARAPRAGVPEVDVAPEMTFESPVRVPVDPAPRPVAPARPRAAIHESAPSARTAPPADETAQLVMDAMAALRRDRDPSRASALLDEYLRRTPDGPLAEEALALSIEAAAGLGDPRARALALRYLARYPQGRFHEAAERVSRSAP